MGGRREARSQLPGRDFPSRTNRWPVHHTFMTTIIFGKKGLAAACAGAAVLAWAVAALPGPAAGEPHGAAGVRAAAGTGAGPLREIHAHVCGFHFYSGDRQRALRVDHYCSHLSSGVFQCVIYDSDAADARLIGVEYIIGEAMFAALPAAEKTLWHSHRYEVMSGLLTAPDASPAAEKALMHELVNTYGKTWHLWQVDRGDVVPLGLPKLMMGFTADGQIDPRLVAARDRTQSEDTATVKARRGDLPARPVAAGADGWQSGPAVQISDEALSAVPVVPEL